MPQRRTLSQRCAASGAAAAGGHAAPQRWRGRAVELPQLDLAKFTDGYFKAAEDKKAKKKGEDDFFKGDAEKKPLAAEYVANQKALDAALLPALSADLKGYLGSRFTLRDGDRPHLLKF
ncbi:ribosomal protein L6, component of cytosolic 80S ribosome and 60S large subunit [Monoraphidium neglectum]|uniref:Ribosomal protein L6, component of cytosolic 80S ribosome and 60S large subunit n=1 Tax=Monoraphidium neglectum TaxID=145388 RepID=A0A0D2NPW5_9CHLO|nr:ribosomal protein L6, component of cytosolic 80S ribosome and 60S large subunit [Monoraphidium neglectum]KIZ06436.1 ribosomal protein L6, component of cytosolic 80S ribosome and 60S large subunit [Monoraphidium neglectum]|eukprot:XP_013905455.1 ribosomal protein L6, component of cytosolic 80S ribosome and 60S large subunit [Monoraphidium neglectum]